VSSTPVPPEEPPQDGAPATNPRAGMPTSVRVAVIVMSVLAGLLLLYAALTWFNRDQVIDRLVDAGGLTEGQARQVVLTSVIPFGVLGLVLAASAWFLPRRQPWARWVGLTAVVVLALLTLVSVLASGGASILSLLLVVLCLAAVSCLLSRTTSAWVPSLRSRA
jgi:hypothetical protein